MDRMDNVRERFETLEQRTEQWQHHTRMVERRRRGWRTPWHVAAVATLGLALACPSQSRRRPFIVALEMSSV